jgi:hypothetical protein
VANAARVDPRRCVRRGARRCLGVGRALVWDQVGLLAVTTGREVRGMFFLHHPAVFVRVNGHEYSWQDFRDLFWLHSVLVPIAMAVAFAWAMFSERRSEVSPT